VLFLSCACVSVSGVLFSVGVCMCDLLIFLQVSLQMPPSGQLSPLATKHVRALLSVCACVRVVLLYVSVVLKPRRACSPLGHISANHG